MNHVFICYREYLVLSSVLIDCASKSRQNIGIVTYSIVRIVDRRNNAVLTHIVALLLAVFVGFGDDDLTCGSHSLGRTVGRMDVPRKGKPAHTLRRTAELRS